MIEETKEETVDHTSLKVDHPEVTGDQVQDSEPVSKTIADISPDEETKDQHVPKASAARPIQVEQRLEDMLEHIPCLFLPNEDGGNKLVLYFHGNAEDIGLAFDLLYMFGTEM